MSDYCSHGPWFFGPFGLSGFRIFCHRKQFFHWRGNKICCESALEENIKCCLFPLVHRSYCRYFEVIVGYDHMSTKYKQTELWTILRYLRVIWGTWGYRRTPKVCEKCIGVDKRRLPNFWSFQLFRSDVKSLRLYKRSNKIGVKWDVCFLIKPA